MSAVIRYSLVLGALAILAPGARADDKATIMRHLDERITLNEEYRDRFVEEARESPLAKEVVPLEKEVGQGWVDYLNYVKSTKNLELIAHVVKIELVDEMLGCLYDLEVAEGFAERARLRAELASWKSKKTEFEAAVKALGIGTGAGRGAEPKP